MPSPSYHHGNLRQALLEQALQHLVDAGPEKLSLRALARDVGVSQTAPYRHFADKNALLASLAAEGYRRLTEATHEEARRQRDPLARLYGSGLAYIRFARQNAELYKLMFGPLVEKPENYAELTDAGSESFQSIMALVIGASAAGLLVDEPPILLAMSVWSGVHGIASLWIDGLYGCVHSGLTDDRVVEGALRTVHRGLLNAEGLKRFTNLPQMGDGIVRQ